MATSGVGEHQDPSASSHQRYWDGRQWVEHVGHATTPSHESQRVRNLAQTAMIWSLAGLLFFPAALIGLITGIRALVLMKQSDDSEPARGMAIASTVIGALVLAATTTAIVILAVDTNTAITSDVTAADQSAAVALSGAAYYQAISSTSSPTGAVPYPTSGTAGPTHPFTAVTTNGITAYNFSGTKVCVTAPNTSEPAPAATACP